MKYQFILFISYLTLISSILKHYYKHLNILKKIVSSNNRVWIVDNARGVRRWESLILINKSEIV